MVLKRRRGTSSHHTRKKKRERRKKAAKETMKSVDRSPRGRRRHVIRNTHNTFLPLMTLHSDSEEETRTLGRSATEIKRDSHMETAAVAATTRRKSVSVGMEKKSAEGPPSDDCCPICFESFSVPCRSPCGHWFCGGCILQYWNYSSRSTVQPCKCPMCLKKIIKLTPEASLLLLQEPKHREVLENIQKYNQLFVGGLYGFVLKVLELPISVKRMLMDPERLGDNIHRMRMFAVFLGVLYSFSPFDFLPRGFLNAIDFLENSAIVLTLVMYLITLCYRRIQAQRVRHLAGIQP